MGADVGESRIVGFSGQSLPILAPLLTIDVLWSDLHMVHEGRSLMSYDSFYCTFCTAWPPKILARSGALSFWKKNPTGKK